MPTQIGRLMAAHALLLSLAAISTAQSAEVPLFKIELKSDDLLVGPSYICELQELRTHQRVGMADLGPDDTFSFRNVPSGDYQMVISDRRGEVVIEEMVMVNGERTGVTVRLPARKEQRPPAGPVSFSQLQHPPARKAFSAMVMAQRFSEAGDYKRAAEELEKAVRISPDYAEAYANLGVQHIRLGEYDRAVEELNRANGLMKPGPMQLCNLAYAQMQLKRYDEAMESVRASLRLDGSYPQAHYVLGALLARNPRTLGDALPHLELAAKGIPSAEKMLQAAQKDWRMLNGR